MPKFFNKNELILLMLIILLFDVNGFCDVAVPHIVKKNSRNYVLIFLTLIFVVYSIHVYHMTCHITPPPSVKYKTNDNHKTLSCEEEVRETIDRTETAIKEMDENCHHIVNKGVTTSSLKPYISL